MMYISVCECRFFYWIDFSLLIAYPRVSPRSDCTEVRSDQSYASSGLLLLLIFISSVRSTNVYEEQSLGVFRDDESEAEQEFQPVGSRVTVWSRYLAMHARRQLAFGESQCLAFGMSVEL